MKAKFSEDIVPVNDLKINPGKIIFGGSTRAFDQSSEEMQNPPARISGTLRRL